MRTFDLDDLHIFRCVARAGGVMRAASLLHRVPSNVTTRVKHLEERLGSKLFRRQGRGVVLTDAGHALLAHAEKLLEMAETVEHAVRGGVVPARLRLGSLESAAGARLPPLLSAFHSNHPDVSIELQTGTTAALLHRLDRFEIDAAFVSEPFEPGASDSQPVFSEELVLISPRGSGPIRKAADVGGATVVAFPHGCSYRRCLTDWLAEAGVTPGRMLDLGSYHAIVACVAAGMGIAIVPAVVLDHAALGNTVERHRLPARLRTNRTHLVWSGEPSPALRAMMKMLPRVGQHRSRSARATAPGEPTGKA